MPKFASPRLFAGILLGPIFSILLVSYCFRYFKILPHTEDTYGILKFSIEIVLAYVITNAIIAELLRHFYWWKIYKKQIINTLKKYKMPYIDSYFVHDAKSYFEYIIFGRNYLRNKEEKLHNSLIHDSTIFHDDSCSDEQLEDSRIEYLVENHPDYFCENDEVFPPAIREAANRMLGQMEMMCLATQGSAMSVWDGALQDFYEGRPK